jgi:solute carrier family 39 (zinc transporter), member 1/2/3
MANIITFKVVALVTIFLIGLSGGLLSRKLAGTARSEMFFSMGNAFAGGVFLGAGLIHMLPDAQAGFQVLTGNSTYPWFALATAAGFLGILFLEKVLLYGRQDSALLTKAADRKSFFPLVLLLVLSIHSIIVGIALGTESRISQAAVILIAVLAHKGTASFALGVSLLHAPEAARRRFVPSICLFAAMTPLGLLMGIGLKASLHGTSAQAFEAIFDALAAGTFLYIALLDILVEEFTETMRVAVKFSLVVAGLGLMALVAIWT